MLLTNTIWRERMTAAAVDGMIGCPQWAGAEQGETLVVLKDCGE